MEKDTNISHGLKWGVIIGAVYCVFLFLRYNQGNGNALKFGLWMIVGYVTVLILLLISGIRRKKNLGGYIDLKTAFQTMFVAVLGFEFIYMAFNFLYLKFIDPHFFEHLRPAMEDMLEKMGNISQDEINERLKSFDKNAARNMNLGSSLTSFAFFIMVSGMFALIFALIIRKTNPFPPTNPESV